MSKPRGFSVLTRCKTVEDFIDEYRARSFKDTIFVPYADPRLFNSECGFAILLANHHPILAGTCIVLDVFTDVNNPFNHVGMNLKIRRMGPDSQQVFHALEAARELEDDPDTLVKPIRTAHGTQRVPQLGDDSRETARARSPSFMAPANPFTELTDASLEGIVDCRLHDNTVDEPIDDEDTLVKTTAVRARSRAE